MRDNGPYRFHALKIRTLADQRLLMVWTVVSFLASLVLTGAVATDEYLRNYFAPGAADNGRRQGPARPAPTPPWVVFGADKLTFILLGYDEVDEYAHRSDTLMVGAVDFYARTARVVSIPRDTLVYIPGHSFNKVNAAYALGGEELVKKTVEGFAGVGIDYVVAVNYRGFVEVVDALGGVDISVDRAMHYDDRRGNVHIHIEPGEHHFDGEQALNYARFRHDATGDLGRIERQQKLMRALIDQAVRPANWTRLRRAGQAFVDNIHVTVNPDSPRNAPEAGFDQVMSIIGFLTQLEEDGIRFYCVPTEDIWWQGLSCLRPIYSRSGEVLAEVFEDDAPIAWSIAPQAELPEAEPEHETAEEESRTEAHE